VGFLHRLWKAISDVQFSDMPGSSADPEDARKRAQAVAPVCQSASNFDPRIASADNVTEGGG
jgi:hypothetical protein